LYAYYGKNGTKQNYSLTPNIFDENFGEENIQSVVSQSSNTPLRYTGLTAEIISKQKRSEYGLELSSNFDHDDIDSFFSVDNGIPVDSLSNETSYKNLKLGISGNYTYAIADGFNLKSYLN